MIRKAKEIELESIIAIYDIAKNYMYSHGNTLQWDKNYPSLSIIKNDLAKGNLYVVIRDDEIIGVFSFAITEDETYNVIYDGKWHYDLPYGVIHRLASNGRYKGLFNEVMQYVLTVVNYVRIDTSFENDVMRSLLVRFGFKQCGTIYVRNHAKRLAFDFIKEESKGLIEMHLHDTEYPNIGYDNVREISRAFVLNDEGYVSLLHISGDDIFGHRDYYESSGGGIDANETKEEAIIRELDEELGYNCAIIKYLGVVYDEYNLLRRKNINHYFLCKTVSKTHIHHVSFGDSMIETIHFLPIDEAIAKYEAMDGPLARLVKERELPVLKFVKKILEMEN